MSDDMDLKAEEAAQEWYSSEEYHASVQPATTYSRRPLPPQYFVGEDDPEMLELERRAEEAAAEYYAEMAGEQ
jgi:hypothetical protein